MAMDIEFSSNLYSFIFSQKIVEWTQDAISLSNGVQIILERCRCAACYEISFRYTNELEEASIIELNYGRDGSPVYMRDSQVVHPHLKLDVILIIAHKDLLISPVCQNTLHTDLQDETSHSICFVKEIFMHEYRRI